MRHPHLKPSEGNRVEELERRLAAMEARIRRMPVRDVTPGATATTIMVQQTAHGFAAKDVLRHNGTSWTKAQADTAANAVVGGMVVAVISPDVFVLATAGYVAGLSGLTAGSVHYLSAATAGLLTTTAPSISVPVLIADSATSGAIACVATSGGTGPGSGIATSVLGVSGNAAATRADIQAGGNGRVLQRNGDAVSFSATQVLGTGHRTGTATVGSIDIAITTDGDAVRISNTDGGIAVFDRSVSTTVPLIVIGVGHASLNATGRALSVREIDVCDAGVAKKMLVLGSAAY